MISVLEQAQQNVDSVNVQLRLYIVTAQPLHHQWLGCSALRAPDSPNLKAFSQALLQAS